MSNIDLMKQSPTRFVKYKILLERVEENHVMKKDWKQLTHEGAYGYTPETPGIEYLSTKVLEMEIREEIDLRNVVKAILQMP